MFSTEKKTVLSLWYKNFSSQPHQGFFASGVIFLLVFILTLFSFYSNIMLPKVSLLTFHAYPLIFIVFIQFFLGFLFVVFPRFLMQCEIKKSTYMRYFFMYFLGSLLFFISIFLNELLVILASIIIFIAQILSFKLLYNMYKKSKVEDKYDMKWVLIAFFIGLISNFIYIFSFMELSYHEVFRQFSINTGFYLFLFVLIFTIAQRMIPFFTSIKLPTYVINKTKSFMELIFVFLVFKVALLTYGKAELNLLADIPLFLIFTRELIKWKLPLFKLPAIMWILYLSLYWIPIGFLISSIESILYISFNREIFFEKAVTHIFAIGFFISILLGLGTRVVLGHSGRTPTADTVTIFIFILMQFVLILRIFTAYTINLNFDYIFWVNISSSLFIVTFLIWSVKYLPILLKGK